jgi:hypothetical protein
VSIYKESKSVFSLHLLGIKMSSVTNILKLRLNVGIGGHTKRVFFVLDLLSIIKITYFVF